MQIRRVKTKLIKELPGPYRLGRHIHFDKRSKNFPINATPTLVTKTWSRTFQAFDQGQTGSCTGNGAAGVCGTAPFKKTGQRYDEALARKVYSLATKIDDFPGAWPPDDTGSSCLAAMKAAQQLGLITNYKWGFGLDQCLAALSNYGPVSIGVNWYEGMDNPQNGMVQVSGKVRGGHCVEVLGINVEQRYVIAENSWGKTWGLNGRFYISFSDLDRLLKENGECVTASK